MSDKDRAASNSRRRSPRSPYPDGMRLKLIAPFVLLLGTVAACSDSEQDSTPSSIGKDGGARNATSNGEDVAATEPSTAIVDAGFGATDDAAQAMIVVTTTDANAIGESVTVTVNFLDKEGQILATEEQVESFNWVGQELAMPVWLYLEDLPGNPQIASIDPSVSVSDYGMKDEPQAPLPVLDSTEIRKGPYGDTVASFAFTNDSSEELTDLRVGVVCYNPAGKIVGGTSTYPELAPAGKTIRIDADVTVTGKPSTCKAFVNYDVS